MDYIGIDIGGTKCAVVKGNLSDGVTQKCRFETTTLDETLEKIFSAVEAMMPCEAIGISCGGPLDERRGVILSPPNLPGFDEVHITDMLTERFGVEAYLCNDANACALAELRFGAGVGSSNMIFLTFGTGLGAGLIINGRLYSGTNGNAGEVGHVSLAKSGPLGYGKRGSFEGFCSGGGITRLAQEAARSARKKGRTLSYDKGDGALDALTTRALADMAKAGECDALCIFEKSAAKLGEGLAILIDLFNPDTIVIGSVYARCEELFYPRMSKTLRKLALPKSLECCRIVPAMLGEEIGDIAALCVAIEGKM